MRFADATTEGLIGNAILPSLLHQDPRYFYQGNGPKKSRALHAILAPFICKGDNGKAQPNYSHVGRQPDFFFISSRITQVRTAVLGIYSGISGPAWVSTFLRSGPRIYLGEVHRQK